MARAPTANPLPKSMNDVSDDFLPSMIYYLQSFPWWGVLVVTFLNSYIENIFPPSPSDVILVFIGTLCGIGVVDCPSALAAATIGSALGFATMFIIGSKLDRAVVESGRYKFIPVDAIHKAEAWFQRWGYYVIVANRFLSCTRAIISFLAGMSQMKFIPTTILCTISALVWNGIILYAGMQLGENWQSVDKYLRMYSTAISVVIVLVVVYFGMRWVRRRKVGVKRS